MVSQQMIDALAALRRAERLSKVLPRARTRTLSVRGWEAVDETAVDGGAWRTRIPSDASRPPPEGDEDTVVADTAASMVRLSKFSRDDGLRVRAFYPDVDPPVSMKLIVADRRRQTAVLSDVAARKALGRSGHLPAPPLLETVSRRRFAYLVEPIIFGRHPAKRPEKRATAGLILPELLAAHRHAGLTDQPTDLNTRTMPRLERLCTHVLWRERWPSPTELLDRADALLESDLTIPAGWCHGDLVFSNVIIDDAGRPQLIDWEHARIDIVAADLAKLFAATFDAVGMVRLLESTAHPDDVGDRPGRHPVRHQLVVAYLRELSWWEGKQDRARAAGRLENFELWAAQRLDTVIRLL